MQAPNGGRKHKKKSVVRTFAIRHTTNAARLKLESRLTLPCHISLWRESQGGDGG